MKTNRKEFLKQISAAGAGLLAIPGMDLDLGRKIVNKTKNKIKNPIGCSTYSFAHYGDRGNPSTTEEIIEKINRMGFDGVEILRDQMLQTGGKDRNRLQK